MAENTLFGRIIKSTGGLYTVETENAQIFECRAKGTFKKEKLTPLTGDNVEFLAFEDKSGFITDIKDRKNEFVRPAVANVDTFIIVIASAKPEPDLYVLDKLTAVARFANADVLLLINKCDIKNADELKRIYLNAGIDTVCLSAAKIEENQTIFEEIREKTSGKICFFSGASGVGKTSILNALYPGLELRTGEISRKISRGKHTTRVSRLFKVGENTYIGDTPGFGLVDVAAFNMLTLDGLLSSFPDIEKYAHDCKYTDCTHLCEEGCSVMKALEDGKIEKTRHESYVKLYGELKKIKPWNNK
ncbi:MAG: ribosome small subunit-dependent GTPase A [Clostridia bacterium]|nr:ribosome small subunit-dependent GTPase A [Clostridia bacterium]